jgi:hypothetical protein
MKSERVILICHKKWQKVKEIPVEKIRSKEMGITDSFQLKMQSKTANDLKII